MMNLRVDEDGRAIKQGEQVQIGGNESPYCDLPQAFLFGAWRAGACV